MRGFDNNIEQMETNLKEVKENQINENLICIGAISFGIIVWLILFFTPGYLAYTLKDEVFLSFLFPFLFATLIVIYFTKNLKKAIISGLITFLLSIAVLLYLALGGFSMVMR
jgi:hypothetical protein